mmetsp:Transcript_31980/g.66177  ORF Transcript_31980/g.66177 Transcript_31980/m.66177 type:complete len:204 (+) Transcript_31980:904-1515(+)
MPVRISSRWLTLAVRFAEEPDEAHVGETSRFGSGYHCRISDESTTGKDQAGTVCARVSPVFHASLRLRSMRRALLRSLGSQRLANSRANEEKKKTSGKKSACAFSQQEVSPTFLREQVSGRSKRLLRLIPSRHDSQARHQHRCTASAPERASEVRKGVRDKRQWSMEMAKLFYYIVLSTSLALFLPIPFASNFNAWTKKGSGK